MTFAVVLQPALTGAVPAARADSVASTVASGGTVPVAGAEITATTWLTERTLQLSVRSTSFRTPALVEVTFPTGYAHDTGRRWPVTYYLHGLGHDQTTFRASYAGETLTRDYPSIVVSPNGSSGFWSDWYNFGADGPPDYETFVVQQLIPLIDANFRTLADRAHRVVMGESMGGYGTMMLAARHPDMFVAAASLSGGMDNHSLGQPVIVAGSLLSNGLPGAIYGPYLTQEVRWRGHNPVDLAGNLGNLDLQFYTGNGTLDPSRGETLAEGSLGCLMESGIIQPTSVKMHHTLLGLGIPHSWTELSWGCHSAASFEYEISQAVRRFETVLARPPTPPADFDHRSIEPEFQVWDWSVRADPSRALEFLNLTGVSKRGLTLTGSGNTTVTTPPYFSSASSVTVTVDGRTMNVIPHSDGRITFQVGLGPANRQQEYTPGASTTSRTAVITFSEGDS
ncbi:alpha/beta hydrolase [Streptomyces sp. NPDC057718]|uniref:alpha/beta hydrolase n=1 Tax=Streptomyces sp. NPDC057718 TaxID=3346225 RepID=UPI0036A3AA28